MATGCLAAFALAVALVLFVVMALTGASVSQASTDPTGPTDPSRPAAVPAAYWPWYLRAGQLCPSLGITPLLLAAQGDQESGFNPNAVSPTGAEGIAQFEPGTWPSWSQDDDGTGDVSPFNPNDAIMAQARFMCALATDAENSHLVTASATIADLALAGYNAGWGAVESAGGVPDNGQTQQYVTAIMARAASWALDSIGITIPGSGIGSTVAQRAVSWVGTPYVYGDQDPPHGPNTGFCAGTPENGEGWLNGVCFAATHVGFDCSGLVEWAWWPYVQLPRVAEDQFTATASHPVSPADLQPGDLLFLSHGGVSGIYHVGMYIGGNKLVQAPHTGASVEVSPVSAFTSASDFYGATSPAG